MKANYSAFFTFKTKQTRSYLKRKIFHQQRTELLQQAD